MNSFNDIKTQASAEIISASNDASANSAVPDSAAPDVSLSLNVVAAEAPEALNPPNPTHITTDTEAVTSAEHASTDGMVVHSVNVVAIHAFPSDTALPLNENNMDSPVSSHSLDINGKANGEDNDDGSNGFKWSNDLHDEDEQETQQVIDLAHQLLVDYDLLFGDQKYDEPLPTYEFQGMPPLYDDVNMDFDTPNDTFVHADPYCLGVDAIYSSNTADSAHPHMADVHNYPAMPPAYEDVPAVTDYALSPSTMAILDDFLAAYPNLTYANGEWINLDVAANIEACIDPSLLHDKSTMDDDDDSDDDKPLREVIRNPTNIPSIRLNDMDINDPTTAIIAALTDEEELAKVLEDSSDDEECLQLDMIQQHLWVGFDIRYIIHTHEGTYRLSAEQLQERFAGTREALWKYWQTKQKGRIPVTKIRRHLKKMGVSGFFREMLWHLLTDAEYRKLMRLRKQGALHLWQW